MAMSGGSDDGQPMMEMNTTPLIDVMLVLLIMFIITIPPITHAVKIDLPVDSQNNPPPPVDPIVNELGITVQGVVTWNGERVSLSQAFELLKQSSAMQPEPELQFIPVPNAPYERVDQVLAVVKASNVTKFGFVGNENYARFQKSPIEYQ